jgi:hypothetical protein
MEIGIDSKGAPFSLSDCPFLIFFWKLVLTREQCFYVINDTGLVMHLSES